MTMDNDSDDELRTAADGRIALMDHMHGAVWAGRRFGPREQQLVVVVRDMPYAESRARLDALFRYEAPGIAPLAFLGYPDGAEIDAARHRQLVREGKRTPLVWLAEVRPPGVPLVEAPALTEAEVVRLGLGLCDTVLAWAAAREWLSEGVRPDTVYVAGEPGHRFYAGTTPRGALIADANTAGDAQPYVSPLAASPFETTVADATFTIAQVIWFAATREHAYVLDDRPNALWNMEEDRKRRFSGPAAIGRLLDRVLIFDERKRIDIHELRHGLIALARAASVEVPPFPPLGLAG